MSTKVLAGMNPDIISGVMPSCRYEVDIRKSGCSIREGLVPDIEIDEMIHAMALPRRCERIMQRERERAEVW